MSIETAQSEHLQEGEAGRGHQPTTVSNQNAFDGALLDGFQRRTKYILANACVDRKSFKFVEKANFAEDMRDTLRFNSGFSGP